MLNADLRALRRWGDDPYFRRHRLEPGWGPQPRPEPGPAGPVFVGGTGRSGTTILAQLVSAHSRYALVPVELRFHTDRLGLPDVLANRVFLTMFRRRLQGRWFAPPPRDDQPRGLQQFATPGEVARATGRFVSQYRRDRLMAGRGLLDDLCGPVATAAGKPCWVEMTPPTITCAPVLHRLFPRAKLLHVVRDGRDVAASVAPLSWGPATVEDGLHWWAQRLRQAERATRRVPGDRVLVVQFERLVATARDEIVDELLGFLGVPAEQGVRGYLRRRVDPDRAHVGRWARAVPPGARPRIERLYRRLLRDLRDEGVRCLPGPG